QQLGNHGLGAGNLERAVRLHVLAFDCEGRLAGHAADLDERRSARDALDPRGRRANLVNRYQGSHGHADEYSCVMAHYTLVYGVRLVPEGTLVGADECRLKLKKGTEAGAPLHTIDGTITHVPRPPA